jgi:TetR/AcrR family transcriptional repressor of multidrug resistance operon
MFIYNTFIMRVKDDNKIQAIRQMTMEMIVKQGFDGLSMQKLAKAANVSPATIYLYFKNREDLLNQLYNDVQQTFVEVALAGFDPELPFAEGLWLQWKNRLNFITEYPVHFSFFEQFRHSPLINHDAVKHAGFKENMKRFVCNAIEKGEMKAMEPEIFWSIAYGTFHSLVKFHLQEVTVMGNRFRLTDDKLKSAFDMVIKALQA